MRHHIIRRQLVRALLRSHLTFQLPPDGWSTQGLGMMRFYLSKEVRIHIWHSAFRVPGVSDVHDHLWDFDSEVVCGFLRNVRYGIIRDMHVYDGNGHPLGAVADPGPPNFMMSGLRCGTGGGLDKACEFGETAPVYLTKLSDVSYSPGDSYRQSAREIHVSYPQDGTVTVVYRHFHANTEHARVFYPVGTEWVSAEPRPATPDECFLGIKSALALLDQ